MKKLLLLLMCFSLMFGCVKTNDQNINNRFEDAPEILLDNYEVIIIELDLQVLTGEVIINNEKKEQIFAANDSIAYAEAFLNFCTRVRVNHLFLKEFKGRIFTEARSFQLIKNGVDITNDITFTDREKLEKDIINIVFYSVPDLLKSAIHTLDSRSIAKYRRYKK